MKTIFFLLGAALLCLSGCGAPPQVAQAPATAATATPSPAESTPPSDPVAAPASSPSAAPPRVVQSGRSSLPTLPQMMDNSPRPTYVPVPTPKVKPGQTIAISNATPTPTENPTLIVSNAPVARDGITPQAAAARELVWVDTTAMSYCRPGHRFFGATKTGYYISEAQAKAQGYRLAAR